MLRAATMGDFASEHGQQVTGAISVGGGIATAAGIAAHAAWVPVVGAAVAAVTLALGLFFARKGPQQKVISTQIVDQLESDPQFGMAANLAAYFDGPRTRASQAQALANFDAAWEWLRSAEACGNPELGNPGRACIQDRDRGGRWDWFALYRDPIASDPQVRDDAVADAVSSILPGLDAQTASLISAYLLPAGLILLGVLL